MLGHIQAAEQNGAYRRLAGLCKLVDREQTGPQTCPRRGPEPLG